MIVIGYMYNNNGMATWCIEASLALYYAGERVILIKSKQTKLPDNFPVEFIEIDITHNRSLINKIARKFLKYFELLPLVPMREDLLLFKIDKYLKDKSIYPNCYLLNQTSFANKKILVPQYVVAWAYKPFLKDYLRKAFVLTTSIRTFKSNFYFAFYWYKADWIGYRKATGVLAVSESLRNAISGKNINVYTVYPGTSGDTIEKKRFIGESNKRRLAVMALQLDDPRKGLRKIIKVLKKLQYLDFELILIGEAPESFKNWVQENNFPGVFMGLLQRQQAVEVLNTCDVLLFGSLVDDWGYVQVEAMSKSMAVLSPYLSPFDEIISRKDYLYDLGDEEDLEYKLRKVITNSEKDMQRDMDWFKERYNQLFTLNEFSNRLKKIISS